MANKPLTYVATYRNGQYLSFEADDIKLARDHARHACPAGTKVDVVERSTDLDPAKYGTFTTNAATLFKR